MCNQTRIWILAALLTCLAAEWSCCSEPLALLISDPPAHMHEVAFSPDGKWLAAGVSEVGIFVLDTTTHEKVAELKAPSGVPRGFHYLIRFTPDGQQLVEIYSKGIVRQWDGTRGWAQATNRVLFDARTDERLRREYPKERLGLDFPSTQLVLSPDMRTLGIYALSIRLTPSLPFRLLDLITKRELGEVRLKRGSSHVIFSKDSQSLIRPIFLPRRPAAIQFWSVKDAKLQKTMQFDRPPENYHRMHDTFLLPDGRRLAVLYPDQITFLELDTGRESSLDWEGVGDDIVWDVKFSPDGRLLGLVIPVVDNRSDVLRFYDVSTMALRARLDVSDTFSTSFVFSPDCRSIATLHNHSRTPLRLWKLADVLSQERESGERASQ